MAKVRKKKDEETEKYDIIQLDKLIKDTIKKQTTESKRNEHRRRVESINRHLHTKDKRLEYRYKKNLQDERVSLEKKIHDIENNDVLAEYICISHKIISEYMDILKIPVNISFVGKKTEANYDSRKEELLQEFLEIAKNYIPIKFYKREQSRSLSCECGNSTEFTYTDNTITCEICGIERSVYTIQTNFKDIDRVNLSQKYKYSKRVYFRDTVNRYEGKQNRKIEKAVYDDVDNWFDKHNLLIESQNFHDRHRNITKDHLYMALSETGHNLHYEDINLIHNQFTGIPCPDISHIRNELFEDFDRVMDVYDSLNVDRINSLNSQYILYQLLKRRKVKINENDFGMLKTRDRLIDYDEIYQKICLKLEWTFIPIV